MNKEKRLIDELCDHLEQLSPWERQFLESIQDAMDRGYELSQKQRAVLSKIHEQRIMGW